MQTFFLEGPNIRALKNQNNKWSDTSSRLSKILSTESDGPVAAVGWNTTKVRLYYVENGKIVELVQDKASVGSMPPYVY